MSELEETGREHEERVAQDAARYSDLADLENSPGWQRLKREFAESRRAYEEMLGGRLMALSGVLSPQEIAVKLAAAKAYWEAAEVIFSAADGSTLLYQRAAEELDALNNRDTTSEE